MNIRQKKILSSVKKPKQTLWFALRELSNKSWELVCFQGKIPKKFLDKTRYELLQCQAPMMREGKVGYIPTRLWYRVEIIIEMRPVIGWQGNKKIVYYIGVWTGGPDILMPGTEIFTTRLRALKYQYSWYWKKLKQCIKNKLK